MYINPLLIFLAAFAIGGTLAADLDIGKGPIIEEPVLPLDIEDPLEPPKIEGPPKEDIVSDEEVQTEPPKDQPELPHDTSVSEDIPPTEQSKLMKFLGETVALADKVHSLQKQEPLREPERQQEQLEPTSTNLLEEETTKLEPSGKSGDKGTQETEELDTEEEKTSSEEEDEEAKRKQGLEEAEEKQRQLEEAKRKQELEEAEEKQRQLEEAKRKQELEEAEEKQRQLEEAKRKQELEEAEEKQRQLEEAKRKQELEEAEEKQRQLEEAKRKQELEEAEEKQRQLEAKRKQELEEAKRKKEEWDEKVVEYMRLNPEAVNGIKDQVEELKKGDPISEEELDDKTCRMAFETASKQDQEALYKTVAYACFNELKEETGDVDSLVVPFTNSAKSAFKAKVLPNSGIGKGFYDMLSLLLGPESMKKAEAFCPDPSNVEYLDILTLAIKLHMAKGDLLAKFKEVLGKLDAPKDGDPDYFRLILASPLITEKYVAMAEPEEKAAFFQEKFATLPAVSDYVKAASTTFKNLIGEDLAEDLFGDIVTSRTQADELGYSFFFVLGGDKKLRAQLLDLADTKDEIRTGLSGVSGKPKSESYKCSTMQSCLEAVRSDLFKTLFTEKKPPTAEMLKIVDPIGTDLKAAKTMTLTPFGSRNLKDESNQKLGTIFGKLPTERALKDLQELFPGIDIAPEKLHLVWQAMFKLGHGIKELTAYSEVQQQVARLVALEPTFADDAALLNWTALNDYGDFFKELDHFKTMDLQGKHKDFLTSIKDAEFCNATEKSLNERLKVLFEAKKNELGL